jgi:hypothetical protein
MVITTKHTKSTKEEISNRRERKGRKKIEADFKSQPSAFFAFSAVNSSLLSFGCGYAAPGSSW